MIAFLFIVSTFTLSIGAAEVARILGAPLYVTRKIGHVLGGCMAAIMPFVLSQQAAIAIGTVFVLSIFVAGRFGLFDSIDAKGRSGHGALFFPLGLLPPIVFLWNVHPYLIPLAALMLAFADGLAGLVGEAFGRRAYHITGRKTLEGTLCCFGAAWSLFIIFLSLASRIDPITAMGTLVCAAMIAGIEAAAGRGVDNLLIPSAAGLLGWALLLL